MKLDIREKIAYITLPNGEEIYIDWSINGETIIECDEKIIVTKTRGE